jgi:hypothetical protein
MSPVIIVRPADLKDMGYEEVICCQLNSLFLYLLKQEI